MSHVYLSSLIHYKNVSVVVVVETDRQESCCGVCISTSGHNKRTSAFGAEASKDPTCEL